jgi:hypothetical protein
LDTLTLRSTLGQASTQGQMGIAAAILQNLWQS